MPRCEVSIYWAAVFLESNGKNIQSFFLLDFKVCIYTESDFQIYSKYTLRTGVKLCQLDQELL